MSDTAYYFQANSLVVPEGELCTGKALVAVPRCPAVEVVDAFTVPDLVSGERISCVVVPSEAPLPPHWQAVPLRQVISRLPDGLTDGTNAATRLLRAFHIAQWRRDSMFCGSCGGKNTDRTDELARMCPACGRVEYPRIAPAIITLITNDKEQTLLAHNANFAAGVYSLIAGFVEAGENLEMAVAREIREEVSIEVQDIRYVASQPWPFPHSLMIAFSARYASGDIRPDGVEIEDAQWFSRNALPPLPGPGSVSRFLIEKWRDS